MPEIHPDLDQDPEKSFLLEQKIREYLDSEDPPPPSHEMIIEFLKGRLKGLAQENIELSKRLTPEHCNIEDIKKENERLLKLEQSQNQTIATERQANRRKREEYEKQAKVDYDLIVQRDAKINDLQQTTERQNLELIELKNFLADSLDESSYMQSMLSNIEGICNSEEWRARKKIRMILKVLDESTEPKPHGSEANGKQQQ